MRGVVAAVAIGRLPDGTLVVDPDEEEEECLGSGGGGGCFAFMFAEKAGLASNSDCVWSGWKSMSGVYDESELFRARELARAAASDVYLAMKKSIALGSYDTNAPTRRVVKDEPMVGNDTDDDKMEI